MPIDLSAALGLQTVDKRIDILRRVEQFGSISQAAKSAGVSYKAAWQALETLGTLAGEPVVEKAVGGADGGGAKVTPSGKAVLEAAAALTKIRSQVIKDIAAGGASKLAALASASLRMSVRNTIPCTVTKMRGGLSKVKLTLQVCYGNTLRASITAESAQLLDIEEGLSVLALFKATAADVTETAPEGPDTFVLHGFVTHLPQKNKGGEVTLRLPNGIHVVGFIKGNHALEIGSEAYLCVQEKSVIIALLS